MKTSEVYSGSYLKAEHLGGRSVKVRINHVSVQEFEQGDKIDKKIVIGFEGKDKTLVVNKTNAAIISENCGSDDTDDWIGKTITLTVRKVEFQGKLVPAIRVELVQPAAPAAAPEPPKTQPATEESDSVPF